MKKPGKAVLKNGEKAVHELAKRMAEEAPDLASLSPEDLEKVARAVLAGRLVKELDRRVDLAGIDYAEKRDTFLKRQKSPYTVAVYSEALSALEAWATRLGLSLLELKAKDADSFMASLEGASGTVRKKIAACSSFYTFLDRDTENKVNNPFRGTKGRPRKETSVPIVPRQEELAAILLALPEGIRAALVAMVEHGFRIGAFPSLEIWGKRYKGISKGKAINGELSDRTIAAIKAAGLDGKRPWVGLSSDQIRDSIRYACKRLYLEGRIIAPYSAHDFRHYFAIQEYRANHDIYALKELLGHASIAVTESYLQGLKSYLNGKAKEGK